MSLHRHITSLPSREDGFALVIALSLMAFVLLLLLSISTLVSVDAAVAKSSLSQLAAQQNARLASYMALGDLMKFAGADQRSTARADIVSDTAPYWTGVWSTDPMPDGSASEDTIAEMKERTALKWLVSLANDGGSTLLDAYANPDLDTIAAGAVVLSANDEHPVILPTERIAGKNTDTGGYAFWVSDEGVKASVSLDPDSSSNRDYNLDVRNPSVMELSAIKEFGDLMDADRREQDLEALARSPNLASIPAALNVDQALIQKYQHDLTSVAYSLPVNVRDGGLKKDLSAAFSDATSWSQLLAYHGDDQVFAPMGGTANQMDPGGPMWEQLRSYYQYRAAGDGTIHSQEQLDDQSGVYPVITHFSLHHHIIFYDAGGGHYRPRLCIMPIFVLWNPYNKPIAAENYYLKITDNTIVSNKDSLTMNIQPRVFLDGDDGAADTTTYVSGNNTLGFKQGALFPHTSEAPYLFQINSSGIEPGQALIFSAGENIQAYPADPTQPALLSPGYAEGYYYYKDAVDTMDMNGVLAGTAEITYFALYMNSANFLRVRLAQGSLANVENEVLLQFVGGQNSFVAGSGPSIQAPVKWAGSASQLISAADADEALISGHPALASPRAFPASGAYMHLKMAQNYAEVNNNDDLTTSQREVMPYIKYVANANPRAHRSSKGVLEQANYGNNNGSDMAFNPTYFGNSEMNHVTNLLPANHSYYTFNSGQIEINLGYSDDPSNVYGSGWVLYEIPDDESSFLSIADLSGANLSQPFINPTAFYKNPLKTYNIQNLWPAYSIGNSLQDPRIPAGKVAQDTWPSESGNTSGYYHYDTSYLMNEALWDCYFFSAYDVAPTVSKSLNYRYATTDDFVFNFDSSASGVMIHGGFNVNSTSVEAWKVFLSSVAGVSVEYADATYEGHDKTAFLRVATPINGPTPSARDHLTDEVYNGFLTLESADIESLAAAIVDQVKARGPFVSLSHFINRVLDDTDYRSSKESAYASSGDSGKRAMMVGALQAAIDLSEVNEHTADGAHRFNDSNYELHDYDLSRFYGELNVEASLGDRAAANPGYLTQLDLLDSIGALISVRSDTFKIYAYGESLNSVTGHIDAIARCVVTVQRTADFVDDSHGNFPHSSLDTVSAVNQTFGRGFRIIDFQWLDTSI
ncbi:hypothetical protein SH580_17225 [Coraliomargarita algicola]|uniref:Flp pilus-assembly TadG-like N-terminal domain-containing protein n=1 Tax=Coraliomargarita algicola TaxID=3092156 RepID=A0ABZ0RJ15_9BACT|nr:hypothetical protein [Coraliomargarita sp. J2-16]WPJ95166.1 hypothetical protein SH580_17225 [Coraliomargarita sp. J2-16]